MGTSDENYDAALCRLPDVYARALRYIDAGLPADEICAHLRIEAEALEPLLDLARRKLRTELSRT
ncbi:hypothetical protein BVC93_13135 [Mycobacterium sp. MS1601]|uniref:hypothetical protein n=1 Tax=Mycobacterium sp. MS1601 TaxID=1936029 RepID=UPI0009794E76|nr:hypothetical protein [Mycobacterium sp. MS1601]AQA06369.1 hypothetical protein BVC93_13135 [Mycobacterium sp. MS1601]